MVYMYIMSNTFLFSIRSHESCVSSNDILFNEIQNREHVFYRQISFFEKFCLLSVFARWRKPKKESKIISTGRRNKKSIFERFAYLWIDYLLLCCSRVISPVKLCKGRRDITHELLRRHGFPKLLTFFQIIKLFIPLSGHKLGLVIIQCRETVFKH